MESKAQCHVHKSLQLDCILKQMNLSRLLTPYYVRSILSFHLWFGLPNDYFSSRFPKCYMRFLYPHACCMDRSSHPHVTRYAAPHCGPLSGVFSPPLVQVFTLPFCFQTPSTCVWSVMFSQWRVWRWLSCGMLAPCTGCNLSDVSEKLTAPIIWAIALPLRMDLTS